MGALLAAMATTNAAQGVDCPNGGFWPGTGYGVQPNNCRPDPTGPAGWTDPGTSAGSRTSQVRRAVRSPNSTWYPTLPTGSVPPCNGSFTVPSGSPAPSVTLRLQGRRVLVDYDAPNFYCKNTGDWPPSYTANNDITYTTDKLQLRAAGWPVAEAWIYYDHGTWDTGIDIACPGSATYEAVIQYLVQGNVTASVTTGDLLLTAVQPCGTPDRGSCPAGGDGRAAGTGVGLPINVGSGDVTTTIPLFTVQQAPLSLAFDLTYHSSALSYTGITVPEPLGKGWTHPYNQLLVPIPSTNRLYHYTSDGREHEYTANGSVWAASRPAELRGTVTADAGTSEYRLTDLAGTVTAFDQATGRWKSTRDRWGNAISGTYTSGSLTTLTDGAGRQLALAYSSGRLQSVTIPDTTNRVWTFSSSGTPALLYSIRDPFHASGNPWRSLAYDGGNRLAAVSDDTPKLLEGHTYDAQGRGATSYSEGGQRNYVLVEYDTPLPGQRRVTHRIDSTTSQVSVFSLGYQGGRWLPTRIDGPCSSCGGASSDSQVFTYLADNHVETVTDGRGTLTHFGYDTSGNLTSMIEAEATSLARTTTWLYAYPAWPSFWTTKTEPSVVSGTRSTTRGWTAGETVLTVTENGSIPGVGAQTYISTQTFDAKHRLLSVNGPRPGTIDITGYGYFADTPVSAITGRLHTVTDTVGLATTLENYDVYGTARTTTDPNGVITELVTDPRGRTTSRTVKPVAGDPEPADYVTGYTYDTRDRLTRMTLPRGNALAYVYADGTNRLTETIRLDSAGLQQERLLLTLNDIGGKTREEAQVCTTPAAVCPSWSTRRSEKYAYDTKNRLWQMLFPVPLPADSKTIAYAYDGGGLLASVKDERHIDPNTIYTYDALGRLWTVTQKMPLASKPDVGTTYGYDVHDSLTSLTDPNGNVTTWVWDDFRRLRSQTSPMTGATTYEYDEAGNLLTSTDVNTAVTTRTYDGAGRLLTASSARAGRTTELVTNTYDDAVASYGKGRLKSASVSEGGTATTSTTYTWDRRGLPRSETQTILGTAYALSFGTDANGNRTRVTYPSGRIVTYTYDFADRPLSAVSGGTTYVSSAAYEPYGPEKSLAFGNGTTRTAAWNERYQPDSLALTGGSVGAAVSYTYALDALGNITGSTDNGNTSYSRTFVYDDLNRLTTATTPTSGAPHLWGTGTYAYDALGNRTALTLGSRSVTYAYDVVSGKTTSRLASTTEGGTFTSLLRDSAGNETAFGPGSSLYSSRNSLSASGLSAFRYDARGIRVAEEVASGSGLFTITPCRVIDTRNPDGPYGGPNIPAGGSRSFTFQGQCGIASAARAVALNVTVAGPSTTGFLALFPSDIPKPVTSTISFSAGKTRANNGLLGLSLLGDLTVFNSSTSPAQTIVDVAGYFRESTTSRRVFLYSPELSLLAETNTSTSTPAPLYEYVWLGGKPVAQEKVGDSSALRYTVTDHLGTPLLQTNAGGAITWRVEHEPFGNVYGYRAGTASDHQPLRFPGQEERSTSPGRFYNIFRWYRPDLGAYSQPDPIGLKGGPNLFQYANSNPVNATDPRGLRTCVIFARDSLAGVDVSHTALVVFGPCTSSGGGCSQPTRFLYDPAGGYRQRERGSGGLFEGSEFTMAGYFAFHAASGTPVEMFCFDTTCCEEQELRKRAESIGDPRGFSCSASVSACLAGVGRFGGIRETGRPGVCRQQIQNLQLQGNGR